MPEGAGESFQIEDGLIMAQVRGSVIHTLGCIKSLSTITIEFKSISAANWSAAIYVASKTSLISRLMLNRNA